MTNPINIVPMAVSGVRHLVERAYRESGEFQYLRELLTNALEAGAKRIEFGPEWNAVENDKVYRLMIADDGWGMVPEKLLQFLNTFGGGGKPIGDAHENYGVGAKTSLLPWNQMGVVVMSWTPTNPDGAMIWLLRDPVTGEYGARKFETDDGYEEVVCPFGEWVNVKPDWIQDHGTVLVSMGATGKEDTFLGKDGKGDIKAIAAYINKRLWDIPSDVEIAVQELRSTRGSQWPRNYAEASGSAPAKGVDRRWNRRRLRGAKHFVKTVKSQGELGASGTVTVTDGTEIDWYLWVGPRPSVHAYAHEGGYIAALYKNELYDTKKHVAHFRSFGITQSAVRTKLTLIARPPISDGTYGVYPDTARNALKIQGSKRAGESLPWADWAYEFAEQMPEPVRDALAKAGPTKSGTLKDSTWKTRLSDRFGARWSTLRYRAQKKGKHRVDAEQPLGNHGGGKRDGQQSQRVPTKRGVGKSPGHLGTQSGSNAFAAKPTAAGGTRAKAVRTRGGIPQYQWTELSNIDENEMYAAAWSRPSKDSPNGLLQLARDFHVFIEVKKYWRDQYADHLSEQVDAIIEAVYGEAMVARIAHSEQLVSHAKWGRASVEAELRSPKALTMAVLGLLSEDYLISARLKALGVRRRPKKAVK